MASINPYLVFDGNCREAMNFYKECLGGELTLQSVEESPMADQWPQAVQQHILHASLVKDKLVLLASDMGTPGGAAKGNSILLSLTCSSPEEIELFYNNLSAGGIPTRRVHDFFGGKMAALTDKFGFEWLLYYGANGPN